MTFFLNAWIRKDISFFYVYVFAVAPLVKYKTCILTIPEGLIYIKVLFINNAVKKVFFHCWFAQSIFIWKAVRTNNNSSIRYVFPFYLIYHQCKVSTIYSNKKRQNTGRSSMHNWWPPRSILVPFRDTMVN